MLAKKTLRRNTLVVYAYNPAFCGRVVRTLPDGSVLWITMSMRFFIDWPETLYTDRYPVWRNRNGKVRPEMSLREFKRKARRWHGSFAFNTPLDYKEIQDNRYLKPEESLRFKQIQSEWEADNG